MKDLHRIIDHFTIQANAEIYDGEDKYGQPIVIGRGFSPLSFAHNDAAHETADPDPMQAYCDSCFLINAARILPEKKTKTEARALLAQMRAALARFGNENPTAKADITTALDKYKAERGL